MSRRMKIWLKYPNSRHPVVRKQLCRVLESSKFRPTSTTRGVLLLKKDLAADNLRWDADCWDISLKERNYFGVLPLFQFFFESFFG